MKHPIKTIRRKIQYSVLYFLAVFVEKLTILLPEPLIFFSCEVAGLCCFTLLKKEREKTISHLKKAFSKKYSDKQINKIAKNVFLNLSRNIAELFFLKRLNKNELAQKVSCEGLEIIEKTLKKGKGTVILSSHTGNWEITSPYLATFTVGGGAVAKALKNKTLNKLVTRLRTYENCEIIDRDSNPKKILKILRENKVIGILADQDIKNIEGVFVEFFGQQTYTPTAPVKIARTAGCDIIPIFMARDPKNKYHHKMTVYPAITIDRKDKSQQTLIEKTQQWTTLLENHIKKYPDQWVWMHKRWKTTPEKLNRRKK